MKTETIIDGKKYELYSGIKRDNPFPTKFSVTFVDKGKKQSWLWNDSYSITVKLNESGEIKKFSASAEAYYKVEVGKEGTIDLYQHNDRLWYPYMELA